jgi:hypothetical protein
MTVRSSAWRVPTALVALGTVSVVAGSRRLAEPSGRTEPVPSDARPRRRTPVTSVRVAVP